MARLLAQSFRLPAPPLTEKNCPDQSGRVFIVTGGYAGVGCQLATILFTHNATVYIAGRSLEKANAAIAQIKAAAPTSTGSLEFLSVDLSDLSTIKPGVDAFLAREDKLHVLVNNAGVMFPPKGSKDKHGVELQIGTNCVGPFLFYHLLEPLLATTAAASPPGTVRVTWAGSLGVDILSPKPGGMDLDSEGRPRDKGVHANYGMSKVGNLFFAKHFARSTAQTGVVHACFNPGNLKTELQRHTSKIEQFMLDPVLHPAIFGAYTELYAAISPDIKTENSGAYVWPWGRVGEFRADIANAVALPSEGGTGLAEKFVGWCEAHIQPYK